MANGTFFMPSARNLNFLAKYDNKQMAFKVSGLSEEDRINK